MDTQGATGMHALTFIALREQQNGKSPEAMFPMTVGSFEKVRNVGAPSGVPRFAFLRGKGECLKE
jgi:hypothetical protein